MSRRGQTNYIRCPDVVERIGSYLGTSFPLFHGSSSRQRPPLLVISCKLPSSVYILLLCLGRGHIIIAAAICHLSSGHHGLQCVTSCWHSRQPSILSIDHKYYLLCFPHIIPRTNMTFFEFLDHQFLYPL